MGKEFARCFVEKVAKERLYNIRKKPDPREKDGTENIRGKITKGRRINEYKGLNTGSCLLQQRKRKMSVNLK